MEFRFGRSEESPQQRNDLTGKLHNIQKRFGRRQQARGETEGTIRVMERKFFRLKNLRIGLPIGLDQLMKARSNF